MDEAIAAALEAGRSVIVPDARRAAALRWSWARVQRARGATVWPTPQILTWEAWLARQWQQAAQAGRIPAQQRLLGPSQERRLWEEVLGRLGARFGAADDLPLHAAALMRAAARATQSLLQLSLSAMSEEEQLLVEALKGVRKRCETSGCTSLSLSPPEQLAVLLPDGAPLLAGFHAATPLQRRLAEQRWPGQPVLAPVGASPPESTPTRFVRAADLAAEIRACARWCRQLLEQDGARRLLVVSACVDPSPATQALMLWRELVPGTAAGGGEIDPGLLAVQTSEPLLQQRLIADALIALGLSEPLATEDLSRLLLSPFLNFGSEQDCVALEQTLRQAGAAHWPRAALQQLLAAQSTAAAAALERWLELRHELSADMTVHGASAWAQRFSQCLAAARFAAGLRDLRELQQLEHWSGLLDEFAALDAVAETFDARAAVGALKQLAMRAAPEESSDAAITFGAQSGDPVATYDGIWVLGLAEQRWPEPPRPDPYVALGEQRRCGWEEASAGLRLQQAQWTQARWRLRTPRLVLSYPEREGDLRHRPAALLAHAAPAFEQAPPAQDREDDLCRAPLEMDLALPVLGRAADGRLSQGLARLRLQQSCAFRAQAEIRLHATRPPAVSAGINPRWRGELLHGLLEALWAELRDQATLLAMDSTQRGQLIEHHWSRQMARLAAVPGTAGITPRMLERERQRTVRLIQRVLELEGQRPPFAVIAREQRVALATGLGLIALRIDRIDADAAGQRLLIDYKSGQPETLRLAAGSAQPLQLALYVQALAQQPELAVQGAALLSLQPASVAYAGVAVDVEALPGRWKKLADWNAARAQWQAEIDGLLAEHARGAAEVAPLPGACRLCHLAGLCRRSEDEAATNGEAGDDD